MKIFDIVTMKRYNKTAPKTNLDKSIKHVLNAPLNKEDISMGRTKKHNFREYAMVWFETYSKPIVEQTTAHNYSSIIKNHILPVLGDKCVEDITVNDINKVLNRMKVVKPTKTLAKAIIGMILENAVQDNMIQSNIIHDSRIKIVGNDCEPTKPYSVEQMRYLISHIRFIKNDMDRMYLAIHATHPLRPEEVFGLKWKDIDFENRTIEVRRAVTAVSHSKPIEKSPKTKTSKRTLALSSIAIEYLIPGNPDDYIFGGKEPLSISRRDSMLQRIKRDTGFEDKLVFRRFRTTVLTDIYDQTKDVIQTQRAAGHSNPMVTFKYYVKGRSVSRDSANAIDSVYGGKSN